MRKFKHKKTNAQAEEYADYYEVKYWNSVNNIPKWIVENSNDWEEIKEQEFKVGDFIVGWNFKIICQLIKQENETEFVTSYTTINNNINQRISTYFINRKATDEEILDYLIKESKLKIGDLVETFQGTFKNRKGVIKSFKLAKEIYNGNNFYLVENSIYCDTENDLIINFGGCGYISNVKDLRKVEEPKLTFGGFPVEINANYDKLSVNIRCKNETGTLDQLNTIIKLINPFQRDFNFGSVFLEYFKYPGLSITKLNDDQQVPKDVQVKMGCTTGTLEELVNIQKEAKKLLK